MGSVNNRLCQNKGGSAIICDLCELLFGSVRLSVSSKLLCQGTLRRNSRNSPISQAILLILIFIIIPNNNNKACELCDIRQRLAKYKVLVDNCIISYHAPFRKCVKFELLPANNLEKNAK